MTPKNNECRIRIELSGKKNSVTYIIDKNVMERRIVTIAENVRLVYAYIPSPCTLQIVDHKETLFPQSEIFDITGNRFNYP